MRNAVIDWVVIAGILGAFLGGFFTPDETKREIIEYIYVESNVSKYPQIIITDKDR